MNQSVPGTKRGVFRLLASILPVVTALTLDAGMVRAQDSEPVPVPIHAQDDGTAAAVFRDHISGPIVQSRCIYCHVEGGRSGHTRLVFVRPADTPDHEALNLEVFADFLESAADDHGDHERILTKIQGAGHGGGVQVPVGSDEFDNMDRFLALLDGQPQGFVTRLLAGLGEGEISLLFGITTPEDGDTVAGDALAVSATGAPTPAVHFGYRPSGAPADGFAYLGAAANGATARFVWNTAALMDGGYELVALFTEDGGDSVTRDTIEVTIDNVAPAAPPDIVETRGHKAQTLRMAAAYKVITADGVVVTLPAGALDGDDRLMIQVVDPPDPQTAPGDAVGIGIDTALASGQNTFREVVTVGLPYPEGKPDGLVDHTSIPETGLSMWFFDSQADAWVLIPESMVLPDADMVVADAAQTGEFGIFNAPLLRVEQDGEAVTGLDFGAEVSELSFTVVNGNLASEPLTWTIDRPVQSWLSVEEAVDMITVSVDRPGLEPGDYASTLHIRSNGGVREVSVSMRVQAAPGDDGGGGCAALPLLPGAPLDPTLMGLLGLVTVYLMVGRRRLRHQAAMG